MLVLPSTVTHLSQKCCFWKGNWQKHPSSSSISLSVTQSHLLIEFQTEAQRQRWNGTLNYVSCENRWTFTQCWPRQFTSKSGTHTHKTHLHGIPEKTEPLNLRHAVILQRGWLKRVKEEEEGRENRKREENNQRGSRGGHRWLQGRSCKGGSDCWPYGLRTVQVQFSRIESTRGGRFSCSTRLKFRAWWCGGSDESQTLWTTLSCFHRCASHLL